ncbi:MAG: chitobiase/beta-hexosaminidase C-terminal domain-containing protein [Candidatus Moraniibacteriota bacterium]
MWRQLLFSISLLLGAWVPLGVQAQTVATPTFSVISGQSTVSFNVTVSDATSGATIYYTLDGTTPTTSSTSVTSGGSISITKSETLKAYAVESGYTNSAVASATYQVTGQVACAGYWTVVLRTDGTVWACGSNSSGQLGDGTTTTRTSPVQVPGLSGVVAVSAGGSSTMALKSDGTVWAWGLNSSGQLGDGTTTQPNEPGAGQRFERSGGHIVR